MRKAMAFGVLAATVALAACNHARGDDRGPAVSRNYAVGGFTAIEVAGPYDVDVRTGGNPSVSANGPQKMIDQLVVEVKGDKLLIHPQEQHGLFNISWGSRDTVRVAVTVPELQSAAITGSGGIAINEVRGPAFDGSVNGSGDLGIQSIDVQTLKLAIAGSGDIKAAGGRAQSVKYAISGSGDIDARGVQAQTADISVEGSGDISAHATASANVSMMGSGDVDITGGAKCSVSKHGSGDVHCS
jgi:hypothetical protein